MVDECAIIMCVISEYACFSGSWQVGETKISAGGVSFACVNPTRYSPHASLACFRTRPSRSSPELTPATRTQDSGSTVSPDREYHVKEVDKANISREYHVKEVDKAKGINSNFNSESYCRQDNY